MKYLLLILLSGCSKHWPASVFLADDLQVSDTLDYLVQKKVIAMKGNNYPINISLSNEKLIDIKYLGVAHVFYDKCDIKIALRCLDNIQLLKSVLWHEIGHWYGFEHSENVNDIMYKSTKPFNIYTNENIMKFISQFNI